MRRSVWLPVALAAVLALPPLGCSDSPKPSAAAVPANPVPVPKEGPSAGGAGAGATPKAPSQGANKTQVQ